MLPYCPALLSFCSVSHCYCSCTWQINDDDDDDDTVLCTWSSNRKGSVTVHTSLSVCLYLSSSVYCVSARSWRASRSTAHSSSCFTIHPSPYLSVCLSVRLSPSPSLCPSVPITNTTLICRTNLTTCQC